MEFQKASIKDAFLIKPRAFSDDRGYFMRAYCEKEFQEAGIELSVVQANLAGSRYKGTLRGMHYQTEPFEEGKLIRCIGGAVFDVVIDIRKGSETYGQWYGAELTASNRQMLYVPPGCAHGYLTLEDNTEVYYLVSEFYQPDAEQGIRWDDPEFSIDWPIKDNLVMSDKDRAWPDFNA